MPNWTKEQTLAIEKEGENIIVSAGAGSGKTAVLTARVIRKLKSGVDIRRLLVLTFTNEAAGEMKQRIRKEIEKEESLKEQLEYIDSSYITTFDSYALSILKKYHYVIGMPKNIKVVESSIIEIKKKEYLDEIFNNLYEKEDKQFLKLIKDFTLKDDNEIKTQILKINDSLELKIDKKDYLDNYIHNYYNKDYVDKIIKEYLSKIINKKEEIKVLYENAISKENEKKQLEYKTSLENLLNSNTYESIKKSLNISLPKIVKNSKDEKTKINDLIKELKELTIFDSPEDIFNTYMSTEDYVSVIIKIIKLLDEMISNYKKETASYEFIDISKMAIQIVKNNNEIREEIKNFYSEIMVDEYQDTNDLQEEFISLIENNNVYMVGDIKQSIYRFRNANPLIFKTKYDDYSALKNGFKIDLVKNFRSREEVLKDINKIFNKIMNDFIGGADYITSHQMVFGNSIYDENKDENISSELEVYNYNEKDYLSFSKEEIEAFIIANDIKTKIKNGYMVLDKETNKMRKATFSDFAIIMDRGSSFDLYRKIFEYNEIPLEVYKDEKLTSANDILILKNILKFIIKVKNYEYDKEFKYLYTSIMRSYLFEENDEKIFDAFVNSDFKNSKLYEISSSIAKTLDEMSPSAVLNEIIEKFDFYDKALKYHGMQNIIIRNFYLNKIVKNLESLGYTPYELHEYLEEMINSDLDIKYKTKINNLDCTKILNIHKSKGLEFNICYYSGLFKQFNIKEFNDRFMFDNEYGIITPYYKDGVGTLFTKSLARDSYIKEEISEKIRLFYVALTRAKEKMILVCPLKENEEKGEISNEIKLKYRSFLDIVNTIADVLNIKDVKDVDLTKNYNLNKDVSFKNLKINDTYEIKNIHIEEKIKEENTFSKKRDNLLTEEELMYLEKGTKLHYLFEVTDFKNPNYDLLGNNGYLIKRFLENDLLKDIENAKIYKEYEFIYEDKEETYHGIIDLMLEYKNHIDIIDYKLSNIDNPSYEKQLKGYKKYIKDKTGKCVNIYLYSIENNILKEL